MSSASRDLSLALQAQQHRQQTAHKAGPKRIPPLFWECDTADLIVLIADMVMQLIEHNDRLPLTPSGLTRFHSRAPPGISVHDYLSRIVRYTSLERISLLSTVIYIDRLCAAYPAFIVSSLTIHRFLITATTVASKGLCDAFCTNTHYAKVGGISLSELNLLELEILAKLNWRILSPEDELQAYYVNLSLNNPKYDRIIGENEPTNKVITSSPVLVAKEPSIAVETLPEDSHGVTHMLQAPPVEQENPAENSKNSRSETNRDDSSRAQDEDQVMKG